MLFLSALCSALAAAQAGFSAVSSCFLRFAIADPRDAIDHSKVRVGAYNLPLGIGRPGRPGIAPPRSHRSTSRQRPAIAYASALRMRLNCSGFITPPTPIRCWCATPGGQLRFFRRGPGPARHRPVVEMINTVDMPGFYLHCSAQVLTCCTPWLHPNLQLQYDIYHMQRMEGELAHLCSALLPHIGHIQIADTPGRHEPGTGEINYPLCCAT